MQSCAEHPTLGETSMNETSAEIAGRWDRENHTATSGDSFNELHIRLDFLERLHYRQYLPTVAAVHPGYWTRFHSWLKNVPDEVDQRILFELAVNIAYFGREDFSQLYQSAFRGPIQSWLIEKLGCQLTDPDLEKTLSEELANHTWYCPLTDSMPISDFCHTNNLGGIRFRPDWISLAKFGDRKRILDFMNDRKRKGSPCPLRRIVILEDFVGSGTQMLEDHRSESGKSYNALTFAASLSATIPVLFVPLIICPVGMDGAQKLKAPNLETRPVLELKGDEFIDKNAVLNGQLPNKVADLARRSYTLVASKNAVNPLYSPFGFDDTGAVVVMYSNTPANTLPMIQHYSDQWAPLFPRSARVK